MISGWAASDGMAMNMNNLPQMEPLKPIRPMNASSTTEQKSTNPVKITPITSMKQCTAEDRFKQRIHEMMKSGSTELILDEDYVKLNREKSISGDDFRYINDCDDVVNYIRNNVTSVLIKTHDYISIALQKQLTQAEKDILSDKNDLKGMLAIAKNSGNMRRYKKLEEDYNELLKQEKAANQQLYFSSLKHIIAESKINFRVFGDSKECDVIIKALKYDDFNKIKQELRTNANIPCSWYPTFGKYSYQDKSLELTSKANIKYLYDIYKYKQFNCITCPKFEFVNVSMLKCCNELVVDYSTEFLNNDDTSGSFYKEKKITIREAHGITKHLQNLKMLEIEGAMTKKDDYWRESFGKTSDYVNRLKKYNVQVVWPDVTFLKAPDFTLKDAMNLASKAKISWNTVINIPTGVKWIGQDTFSSNFKFPNMFQFNVSIPDSVIDIDSSAFSNSYIHSIIVANENVKRLVQASGFTGNITVDSNIKPINLQNQADPTEALASVENMLANTQNTLTATTQKLTNTEKRLSDTQSQLTITKVELAETQNKLTEANRKINSLEERLASTQNMLDDIQKKLAELGNGKKGWFGF